MTVKEWVAAEGFSVAVEGDGMERQIAGGYCGDLLSWVMGRAPADTAWMTVMGNVNAIAVAVLADIACIVLCENAAIDDEALARAEQQGVTVLRTEAPAYEVAVGLSKRL